MLICNSERVAYGKKGAYSEYYTEKVDEIRKEGKKEYTFKTAKQSKLRRDDSGRNVKELPLVTTIPLITHSVGLSGEPAEWWYVENASEISHKDGDLPEKRNPLTFKKNKKVAARLVLSTSEDIELIFYLLHCSKSFKAGRLFEYDEEKILVAENKKHRNEGFAKNLIFSEDSIIAPEKLGTDRQIKSVASAWGVHGIDSMSKDKLRQELWSKVMYNEAHLDTSNKGYEKFIRDCASLSDVELSAIVNLAIGRGLIEFDKGDRYFYLNTRDGSKIKLTIVDFDKLDYRVDVLIKFVSENETISKLINESINVGSYKPPVGKLIQTEQAPQKTSIREEIESLTFDEIRAKCRDNNISSFGKKREELNEELIAILKE